MSEFLNNFWVGEEGELITVAVGHVAKTQYLSRSDLDSFVIPDDKDVWFSPAPRKEAGDTKAEVLGTKVLWVDVDDKAFPQTTFPPTMAVYSGHGWHLYWVLSSALLDTTVIETFNKTLSRDISTADKSAWNANRLLRIPGTVNNKSTPVAVGLKRIGGPTYSEADFTVLGRLSSKTRHKIRTGDRRGYRSRSERDWKVICDLVEAQATDQLIGVIFDEQPVGDKHREQSEYLGRTITEARNRIEVREASPSGIAEQEDGYYDNSKRGLRRVSTFVISPRLLLDATRFGETDAIMGDVTAAGYTWEGVTFSRTAFTTVARMDRECPLAAWQWLGRDDDLRRLLTFLMDNLKGQGMPRVVATPSLGLYRIKDEWFFVGDRETLSSKEVYTDFTGPICSLETGKERPEMAFTPSLDTKDIGQVATVVQRLADTAEIHTMIGWYSATPLKPWLETRGYRFPIINVTGTRGSGKTTLIQRVFMPILGQKEPKTYDSGTTRFVTLALMGGTNAIPIAFSEFRYSSEVGFIRYILLAYDTGHDPRGRSDQTTVDYPLSAPFSVDGEDLISDPAAQERLVVVQLHPETVREGGDAYDAYKEWSVLRGDVHGFGRTYIQYLLGLLNEGLMDAMLEKARNRVFKQFPQNIPDRVRNNHTTVELGRLLWFNFTGQGTPRGCAYLEDSLTTVFNLKAGRGRTIADDFIEDIVNAAAAGEWRFKYYKKESVMWFQFAPAHTWWLASIRRQGKHGLEKDAIRAQLRESEYMLEPKKVRGAWMNGVDLQAAQDAGLDVGL
jgi:hypothetical protein